MSDNKENLVSLLEQEFGAAFLMHGDALASKDEGYCEDSHTAGVQILPRSTEDVSRICKLASAHKFSIVPQGGLTGLVDGTATQVGQVCVSFERMNGILQIDQEQGIVVAEPGVILQDLFDALEPHGLMPGVDIPSKGSCTLGGLVSTNAGGVRVIRYGMMRENVLGLEVVLADGEVIDATNTLMKNNAGYDMKQLFIGSEGTLGMVTKIVLKLHPIPKSTALALVASDGIESLMTLFKDARSMLDARLLSFEVMWPEYYRLTTSQPGFGTPPIATDYAIYAVVEISGSDGEDSADAMANLLESSLETGTVEDAVLANSEAQRQTIWRIREDSDAISTTCDAYLSYDVGMQLHQMAAYVDRFRDTFAQRCPDRIPYVFGHMGDGNLHIMFPVTPDEYRMRGSFDDLVYGPLAEFEGTTVSAEHGIGIEKKGYLQQSRSPAYVQAMRRLKIAKDPGDILNPGKII